MTSPESLPNGRILLERMALSPERLKSGSRAAVSLTILKAILSIAASQLPFDPEFYLATYPDIREAHKSGRITDLVSHFVETGYFEGRMGSMPAFDEQFYMKTYPDIATALSEGAIKSALDHYIQSGACEGRHASAFDMKVNDHWSELVRNA
jgi:hypothetical protein